MPLVTIALAAHNAEQTLDMALKSILAQTYSNWELLLYDDGSTDSTLEQAHVYQDPRIRIVADGRQLGLASRLNQAIDEAQGSLFARMDADDVACPQRLTNQVAYLNAHHDVDLLASGAVIIDKTCRALGLFPTPDTEHADICAHPHAGFYMPHPTWMGRTSWFRRHRYRPEMPKSQDQDLLLRSYRESRFALIPQVLLGYRQDRLGLSKILLSRWVFAKALWRNFRGYRETGTALRAVTGQAAKALVDTVAIGTGLERLMLRHRMGELPQSTQKEWQACLALIEGRDLAAQERTEERVTQE
jgi:glycosyltransferase involved in cell wall biosynthesis